MIALKKAKRKGFTSFANEPRLKRQRTAPFSFDQLEHLFASYQSEPNVIGQTELARFWRDCGIRSELEVLVVTFYLQCRRIGFITRSEFLSGFTKLKIDSVAKLQSMLGELQMNAKNSIDEIYNFAFLFMKQNPAQKVIKVETAIHLLKLLVPSHQHMSDIIQFLQEKSYPVINQDQWRMILTFSQSVGPNFDGYSIDGAWPVLLDEFVVWRQNHDQNSNDSPDLEMTVDTDSFDASSSHGSDSSTDCDQMIDTNLEVMRKQMAQLFINHNQPLVDQDDDFDVIHDDVNDDDDCSSSPACQEGRSSLSILTLSTMDIDACGGGL